MDPVSKAQLSLYAQAVPMTQAMGRVLRPREEIVVLLGKRYQLFPPPDGLFSYPGHLGFLTVRIPDEMR